MIGDMGAFFFGMGGFAAYGVWKKRSEFLFAGAFLIGTASVAHHSPASRMTRRPFGVPLFLKWSLPLFGFLTVANCRPD